MTGKNNGSCRITVILPALAVLMIAVCFFACDRTNQKVSGPPGKITIACGPTPYNALMDIAIAKGYLQQEGLEVTPHFFSTGRAALAEVISGKADFATVGDTPLMIAIMNGNKIAIVATIQNSNKNNAIIADKNTGIRLPRDLKGRRVGTPLGTVGEYFLDAFLATCGMSRSDVIITDLQPEHTREAFANRRVDAASIYPPALNEAQEFLGKDGITFHEQDIYTQTFNLASMQGQISSNPAMVAKMLRALIKAEELVKKSPAEAQKAIADLRHLDMDLLRAVWADQNFAVSLDQYLILTLEDESRWAIRGGLTKASKVPNYLTFIYPDGLTAVRPSSVRIVR